MCISYGRQPVNGKEQNETGFEIEVPFRWGKELTKFPQFLGWYILRSWVPLEVLSPVTVVLIWSALLTYREKKILFFLMYVVF